jgi:transcriptional regulator with XRE-family HTH domain
MPRRRSRSSAGAQFGENVRRLRKARALSQEALAEHAHLATDYVGFIERGDNVPSLIAILKLAKALGVDASQLLEEFTYRRLQSMEL